jgi:hypothetical protein
MNNSLTAVMVGSMGGSEKAGDTAVIFTILSTHTVATGGLGLVMMLTWESASLK